jgi:2-iminobutanoate/2-iminopropanoate deaminase
LPTWSQAVEAHGLVFLAGQSGEDPVTGKMPEGGFDAETRMTLENIGRILRVIGLDFTDVISVTTYLTDMANFETYNAIYRQYFPEDPPARATVQAGLVAPYRIEIKAVAARPERSTGG